MTKQQSLVVVIGCMVAVLMCVGVIALVHRSAQQLPGAQDASIVQPVPLSGGSILLPN